MDADTETEDRIGFFVSTLSRSVANGLIFIVHFMTIYLIKNVHNAWLSVFNVFEFFLYHSLKTFSIFYLISTVIYHIKVFEDRT